MINNIRLQHFRSFNNGSFEISSGVNIVVGPNASGKTNLLEAILVLARGSSYRAKDSDLVQFKKPWTRLDANLAGDKQRTIKITNTPKNEKTYELDKKPYRRLSYDHTLPVVLFEPDHLRLLSGGPERRRDYLDDLLEQTDQSFGATRRNYRRALAQRNALLKKPGSPSAQIFPWDLRLSELAGQIVRARAELVDKLNSKTTKLYKTLSGTKTRVELVYQNRWPIDGYETKMLKELESHLEADRLRGFTGAGPHREDLAVLFSGRSAQEVASRGEVRTAVLTLKIIEMGLLEETRSTTPLLLLDDVFSELDGKRRRALTDHLAPYQTFITTTDADSVLSHFSEHTNVIPLAKIRT